MVAGRYWHVAQIPQSCQLACYQCRRLGSHRRPNNGYHQDREGIRLQAKDANMDLEGALFMLEIAYCRDLRAPRQLFGGSEDAFVREISFIDPARQSATITSVNLSLSQFATCLEKIQYLPASANRTSFRQTAEVQARMNLWRHAADGLERWLVQRFEQNAALGKAGFTDVLRQLWDERSRTEALSA